MSPIAEAPPPLDKVAWFHPMPLPPAPDPERVLRRPLAAGETVQLVRGEVTLLFELRGGRCRFLRLQGGEQEEELLLGTGIEASILVELFLPRRPLVLELDQPLALAPGGWLRGYVPLPLGWRIWLQGRQGEPRFLVEVPPAGLGLVYLGAREAGYAHALKARLLPRRPGGWNPLDRAVLPLHLVARGPKWVEPGRLYLPLERAGLRRVGGLFCTDPVRFRFGENGPTCRIRPLARAGGKGREAAS